METWLTFKFQRSVCREYPGFFLCSKHARNLPLWFIATGAFLFENLGMFRRYNSNPLGKSVGDCTVRGISKLFNTNWYDAYDALCAEGRELCDMPSGNAVWGSYLYMQGYSKHMIINSYDHIVTVKEFAEKHPNGKYLLATGSHVIPVISGDYFDSWDSGDELIIYYWKEEWR